MSISRLNPIIARMTMGDILLLRIEADEGNVVAVADIFRRYDVPDAEQVAADFVEARQASAECCKAMRFLVRENDS